MHQAGIWLGIKTLFWVLIPLVVIAEVLWGFQHAHHRLMTPLFGLHFASIACFFWLHALAKKHHGRFGMRVHLPFAIPCSVAFFVMLITGFMLYEQIPK